MPEQPRVRNDFLGEIKVEIVGVQHPKAKLHPGEQVTYDIYPYGLIYHRGALYLVGRSPQREEICHWKVSRIEAAKVEKVHFQRPEGFDLQQHLAKSFGVYHGDGDVKIVVRFAPGVARYVSEATWRESQKLTPQKDGNLLAEFQLSDTEEIKRWIMSFGQHAVVQEPESLKEEIVLELNSLLAAYSQEPGKTPRRQGSKP